MSSPFLLLLAVFLSLLCLCVVPASGQACTGLTVVNGPAYRAANLEYFITGSQLFGSMRNLTRTLQVTTLTMSFYWTSASANTVPIHISLALYGPATCGAQGDSQLLGVTGVQSYAVGAIAGTVTFFQVS